MKKLLTVVFFLSACAANQTAEKKLRFETEWVRSTLKEENYGYRHSERTSPLVDGDTVYQGNAVDGVSAFSVDGGRLRWHFGVRNGVESGFAQNDRLLFFGASDGNFYGINKITGKISWSFPTRTENLGAPLLASGIIYFVSGNNILYALDAKTGKQVWSYNRGDVSSLSIRGAARPSIYKNTLYAGFSDGYLVALNANEGTMLWERKLSNNFKFVDVDATPVVDDENIWVSSYDGALYCLSRVDGQVQWRLDDGGSVPVTIEGDTLYFPSLNYTIYSLNKKSGKVNWKFEYDDKAGIPTQILSVKNTLIFGTSAGETFALDAATGKKLAEFVPGAGVSAAPTMADKSDVFIYSNQANLYKLKLDWYNPQREKLKWQN